MLTWSTRRSNCSSPLLKVTRTPDPTTPGSQGQKGIHLRRIAGWCTKYVLPLLALILIGLTISLAIQTNSTQVSYTLGNGFNLTSDSINTQVIVRNYSPHLTSIPSVELPYSYGASIVEGKARCELNLTEGVTPCGSRTVWLGIIQPDERKAGMLTIHPNHGNFTIKMTAQVWVLSLSFEATRTYVHCWTNDGTKYACGANKEAQLPGEAPWQPPLFNFIPYVLILLFAQILAVWLWYYWRRTKAWWIPA